MHSIDNVMPEQKLFSQVETQSFNAWLIVFTAGLFFLYEFIQMNMFNAISSHLMQTFSLNATQLGHLSAYYFYANLIFLIPAGLILDRFSTKKVILTAMTICVIGTYLFAVATNIYLAKLFRFATGIGSAFCFLGCVRLASRWFPPRRMALVTGLIVTMAMIGGMIAQTPFTTATELFGWRQAVLIDAGFGTIILIVIGFVIRDYPSHKAQQFNQEQQRISKLGLCESIRQVYLKKQNWLCGIYTCVMNFPIAILGALWGGLFLKQAHHFTATQASYITSMIFVGTIFGAPFAGWLSDRLALRRVPMLIGSLLSLITIFFIIYWPFHQLTVLMLMFFILGFVTSTQIISYPTVAESNKPLFTASAVSVVSFITISGYAISQPLYGRLMDWRWDKLIIHKQPIYSIMNFNLAMMILPIGFIIAIIATLLIRETHACSKGQS